MRCRDPAESHSGMKNTRHTSETGSQRAAERVLVLGDSALTALGCHFPTAIDLLCEENAFDCPVVFDNLSAVGFTSADALCCFREYLETHEAPSAVIIYLGNCDACAYGPRKPWATESERPALVKKANDKNRSAALFRRNPPFAYLESSEDGKALERSVPPEDYARFLMETLDLCLDLNIKAILVNPVSKPDFPPCNNTGNFLAYRLCGFLEDRGMTFPENRSGLAEALGFHSKGDLKRARALYLALMNQSPEGEIARLCKHNLAVLLHGRGDAQGALEILAGLEDQGHPLNPLGLYCRAVILESLGKENEASELFAAASEQDWGTYRVTKAYGRALSAGAGPRRGKIWVIDQADFTGPERFVDYCHPDKAGHEALAQRMGLALRRSLGLRTGKFPPQQAYLPCNPDSYAGAKRNFFEHYGFVVRPRKEFAEQTIALARDLDLETILAEKDSFCPDPARRARLEILSHPLFGDLSFLQKNPPVLAMDQGSLPLLYFIRHLAPFYKGLSRSPAGGIIENALPEIMPRPAKLSAWLPTVRRYAPPGGFSRPVETLDLDAANILDRAGLVLRRHLRRGAIPHERVRGITYWFFKESMWFGSSSHWTMLCNRLELASVLDTAAYMLCGLQAEDPLHIEFESILRASLAVFKVHKKHLAPLAHRPRGLTRHALEEYDRELRAMGAIRKRSTADGTSIEPAGGTQIFPERAMASSGEPGPS